MKPRRLLIWPPACASCVHFSNLYYSASVVPSFSGDDDDDADDDHDGDDAEDDDDDHGSWLASRSCRLPNHSLFRVSQGIRRRLRPADGPGFDTQT